MSRVSEDARNNVVFLGYDNRNPDDPAEITPEGTGFLLHCGEGGIRGVYLVTAGHVAMKLGSDPFVVRQNDATGNARLHPVDSAVWYRHADPGIDIAVMRYEGPDWVTAAQVFPFKQYLDQDRIDHWEVGPGDAVYLVGLFYLRHGKRRNLPVVHGGQIAMMPSDDPIPVARDDGSGIIDDVSAYLVELHALGGASGSPVYLRPTVRHMVNDLRDGEPSLVLSEGRDYLMGVWVATWPGNSDLASGVIAVGKWIPVGIGIVVPIDRIAEILQRPDLVAERRRKMAKDRAANAARPTNLGEVSGAQKTESGKNPNHREDFNRLVRAASKPKPKGDQT